MWVRSAIWMGQIRSGEEERFRGAIDGDLVPILLGLPGVRGTRVLWPRRPEPGAPNIACQMLVEFDDQKGLDAMLASDGRQRLRTRVKEIAALFDGEMKHIDYEVGTAA